MRRILDELIAASGYHEKSAIRGPQGEPKPSKTGKHEIGHRLRLGPREQPVDRDAAERPSETRPGGPRLDFVDERRNH
jgi:hypothetical protein